MYEKYRKVLFEVHWLNVPHSLKIPSSFGDDSTIKRLTERNFPRRSLTQKRNLN
jgi:hypothetical protein